VVAQLMPGAGGIRAVEFMTSAAPQDGTALIILPPGPILEPLIGARKTNYRMVDFPVLGAISKESSICAAWHATRFRTLEDARRSEMIVAGTGAGSSTDLYPVVMNEVLGTRFRVITGFQGSQESSLAIERGEVDGRCGWGWTSIKSTSSNWIKERKLNILMQFGLSKNPELPDVPLAIDLAQGTEAKQMLRLLFAPLMLNKPVFAAPKTPPERVAELRAAFARMSADEAFRDEVVKSSGEEPNPTDGEEAQKVMEDIYQTPAPVIERLKKILN
jgi:tripartite-type tricarboxylate transporter receptor subunit TctC